MPDMVSIAAQDLTAIHSTLGEATASAAAPTTAVIAAAEDEVSAGIASVFSRFGQAFQEISAQAQAFHQQFANLLNSGAAAYLSTEVSNAQQALINEATEPAQLLLGPSVLGTAAATTSKMPAIPAIVSEVLGPYQSLFSNTSANLQAISRSWSAGAGPALLQSLGAQAGYPMQLLSALETGNLPSAVAIASHIGQGYANLIEQLTVPVSLSVTALSPSTATLAVGLGLPQVLAYDALGAPVNAASAFVASSAAFFGALQAGNTTAAAVALLDAPANIANAFLNGSETLPVQLPFTGLALTAPVRFSGLLTPLAPFSTTTTTVPGSSLLSTITITAPPVGGLIPGLVEYAPQIIATALNG
ncbi:hypothetical protein MPRM_16630 [Mycobacterium parmense]|uniref:PE domain-containing protein n=2 Tax=Mycobacterium parmense TaxID=185642 RepID=A0A7I7YT65_9MYCO|nr:hypothetical protein MPRM_16630 [Mycobacterium parmense]